MYCPPAATNFARALRASTMLAPIASRAWRTIAHASGIAEIETLKLNVHSLQAALDAAAVRRSAALASHDQLVTHTATAQRSLTSLLQRREAWEAADVARFTELTSREHTLSRSIEAALAERAAADRGAETAQRAFVDAMHERCDAVTALSNSQRLSGLPVQPVQLCAVHVCVIYKGIARSISSARRPDCSARTPGSPSPASTSASSSSARHQAPTLDGLARSYTLAVYTRTVDAYRPPAHPCTPSTSTRCEAAPALRIAINTPGVLYMHQVLVERRELQRSKMLGTVGCLAPNCPALGTVRALCVRNIDCTALPVQHRPEF